MKISYILLVVLPLTTSAALITVDSRRLDSRDGPFEVLSSLTSSVADLMINSITRLFAPTVKAIKIENLTPRNPAAKRVRLTWGPYKIRGANSTSRLGNSISLDPGGTGYNFRADYDFPTDVTLLDGAVQIFSKEGQRLTLDDNVYTHHFLMFDVGKPQKPSFSCENKRSIRYVPMPGSVIVGGASEDAEAHFTTNNVVPGKKTGYVIKKDTPVVMTIDVVNSNKEDVDVYPTADLEYIPGRPDEYIDSSPVFLAVKGCDESFGGGVVNVPKAQRKWSLSSSGILAEEDAILSTFRGHMHDGGSNVEIKVNDKLVCDSQAIYGGQGHVGKTEDGRTWETIRDMKMCQDGVLVRKGDNISLSAHYDLDAHPARPIGHGHGGSMFGGGGFFGKLMGKDSGDAEQMAVMIVFTAPVPKH